MSTTNESIRLQFAIDGMTCASCVRRVEKAIAAVPGVSRASVNLANETASIVADTHTELEAIATAIHEAGYEGRPLESTPSANAARQASKDQEFAHLKRDLTIAAAFTLPLFLIEMTAHFVPGAGHWLHGAIERKTLYILYFVLASVVQFGPGLRFYRKGLPALMRLAPDMNSLVVLGSTAAWGYSVAATFAPSALPDGTANVYYEASAVIVTLILLGRFLEMKAKGRTSDAIKKLMGLQAKSARVERNGEFVEVALEQVVVGDLVQVRPGDSVPVDGVVLTGSSYVDEAMITGEPLPVHKEVGADVVGGTINKSGAFVFRATKVGADTVLSQIMRMVETAQGAKLPIQAMVDKITAWFVPAVIAVAAVTFLVWLVLGPNPALTFGLVNAVAVLIIACPCAMGLATPTSIMVGTGRAAELGVLFRNGEALQSLKDVSVVALDKTGTLTEGRPTLTDFEALPGIDRDQALALIASVETQSEHPIAAAIVKAAKDRGLDLQQASGFAAVPGFGARAQVAGRDVAVGADRYMATLGIDVSSFTVSANVMGQEGKSPLYAALTASSPASLPCLIPSSSARKLQYARCMGLGSKWLLSPVITAAPPLQLRSGLGSIAWKRRYCRMVRWKPSSACVQVTGAWHL